MPWSNWRTEDHGIKVLGAPAVASWKEGRLDVFVRTTDNRLYHRVYENETWQGLSWTNLADGKVIEASPAAVSWGPNRIDLFAVWGRQVHHRTLDNGIWSPWRENLEGITYDAPAAAAPRPIRVDVLVRTSDNRLSRRYWDNTPGTSWRNWENIGGAYQSLMSAPSAVATAVNRVDGFGRGANNRLIATWYQGAIQESWREIDTLPIKDAPAVASAATADRGRVDVFVRSADDLLKHRVYFTALRRSEAPGETFYTVAPGDHVVKIARQFNMTMQALIALNPQIKPPDYRVYPGDRIVISRSTSESLYSGWEPNRTWEDISLNKIASAPAAVAWWNGNILKRIDCFAQDLNNNLIHTWWK